jgi:ribosomal protein S18 acetylase RimI-like enzyme
VQTWGFSEIYLHVKQENRSARRLYQRVGYQSSSVETPLWAKLLGPPQELLMCKSLGQNNATIESLQAQRNQG